MNVNVNVKGRSFTQGHTGGDRVLPVRHGVRTLAHCSK